MDFRPSKYQQDIFEWFDRPDGSVMVDAVAGGGKTTTLVNGVQRLPVDRRVGSLFAAFNSAIVEELKGRLNGYVTCQTLHSLGYSALRSALDSPNWEVDGKKYQRIIGRPRVPVAGMDPYTFSAAVGKVWQFVQQTLTPLDAESLDAMCLRYGIELPCDIEPIAELLPEVDRRGREECAKGFVSFTDMIWAPLALNLPIKKHQLIAVDECQDLNRSQHMLLQRAMRDNGVLVGVGDPCQPVGTKVLKVISRTSNSSQTEWVDIETVQVGDELASPSVRDACVYASGKVEGVTHRPFNGELVTVEMEDGAGSSYTPNHYCFASFAPFKGQYYVYLQQRGNQFRVGVSCNSAARGNVRFCQEDADAMWILAFYPERDRALMMEAAIAGRFGISELTWSAASRQNVTLQEAWDFIGDNYARGVECLRFFGRDVRYPLITKKVRREGRQTGLKRPIIVHAANLMTGCLMLRLPQGKGRFGSADWKPVTVSARSYTGTVVSFDIAKHHSYIADGIATRNCQAIYAFAGAMNDSFERLREHFGAGVKPLSICYRCPSSVIEMAQEIVPEIEAAPNAPAGVVDTIEEGQFEEMLAPGDMVLCRTNAPLLKLCFELISRKVHARVRGRDIGAQLAALARSIGKDLVDFDSFPMAVRSWRDAQILALSAKTDAEFAIQSAKDRAECLLTCFASFQPATCDALAQKIQSLFSDEHSPVILSTVHKAKGLENPRVFIIRPELIPLVWKGQQPAQLRQEMNLKYVAITRAQQELYFVKKGRHDELF